jgi:hypothetical protein
MQEGIARAAWPYTRNPRNEDERRLGINPDLGTNKGLA